MLIASQDAAETFLKAFSGELMILVVFVLIVTALLVLVPQLLRVHLRKAEMLHAEHLKSLEQGLAVPPFDEKARAAGRTAMLVPMVSVISAATVTCFLIAYRDNYVFAVAMSVWVVAGIVSLAAITGGVALLGRLAQLQFGMEEEVDEDEEKPAAADTVE